ncbi:MAG: phosphate ABC transporter substrate-binding protein [Peptococcaceae bacterium]
MFKKAGVITLVLILALSLVVVGCGKQEAEQQETPQQEEQQPAEAALSGNLKLAGSTSVQPLAEELAMKFMELNREVKIDVAGGGSGAGVESAGNGAADIGMASRHVQDSEMSTYPELKPVAIAQDGITVGIHPNNPVDDLTLEQVKDIFSGKVTNWKEFGGNDASITVVNREEGSGTRGAFEEIVLGEEKFTDKAAVQNSTGAVKTAVAADENAVGYISMGSMSSEVKGLKIVGVEPTVDNVINGTYPIARPFNFITKGEAQGLAKTFIDWVLNSSEAQGITTEEGYIVSK